MPVAAILGYDEWATGSGGERRMRIGVAGIGRMGGAIAARLVEVGHDVTVWNRTPDKVKPLTDVGAKVARTPAELAAAVEAVVTILTDRNALTAVFEGPDGLLAGDVRAKLFIEMSTVQPDDEVALAGKVRAKGGIIVECPVGGTVGPARQGKLLGVAGADKEDFDKAKPLLDEMCRRVELVGPVGAGASMKLALNLPLLVYYQALAEALVLCGHLGLDNTWLMEFLSETSGGPNVLKTRGPAIAAALEGRDPGTAVTFDVDLVCKDLATMLAEAQAHGATLPLVERALAVYRGAVQEGWGGRDAAWLPAYWRSHASSGADRS
jgi:3-hydroxyisobutyrate dehydrogenase